MMRPLSPSFKIPWINNWLLRRRWCCQKNLWKIKSIDKSGWYVTIKVLQI